MTEQTQRDRMWNEWGMLFEIPENEAAAKVGFYAGFNAGQRELKHRIVQDLTKITSSGYWNEMVIDVNDYILKLELEEGDTND